MADKETKLSIVLRTVDRATAGINAISKRLDAAQKPMRDFRKALSELREKSGLDGVIAGFKGVGSAIAGVLSRLTVIGGVAAAATAGLLSLVDQFDDLGDKAEALGVSVDFLAQMRYASERTGNAVEQLDGGLKNFTKGLGQARAGTGRMASFINKVSPALLRQLKAAKGNEEAFDLLARAMNKLEDPAKRAALAQAAFGDSSLATLFKDGPDGIKKLREEYFASAGSMKEAADAAGGTDDALKKLKASTDGAKAALVRGLSPALTVIIDKLSKWLTGHRAEIAEWAENIGERLPGAVQRIVEWVGKAVDKIASFVDSVGGLKTIGIAAAAVIAGPLVGSVLTLAGALAKAGGAAAGLGGGLGGLGRIAAPFAAATVIDSVLDSLQDPETTERGNASIKKLWSSMDIGEAMKVARGRGIDDQLAAFRNSAAVGATQQTAKVTIDIANAPRGTRVRTDPQSSADVDTTVGYQMLPGAL